MRLHALPPYLRAALMSSIRRDSPLDLDGGGSVGLADPRAERPPYLVAWNRDAMLTVEPDANALTKALEEHLAHGGLRREATDLFVLVALFSVWDDVIRELGLYPGRVYLASEQAARHLFGFAGAEIPSPAALQDLLVEAQSLELIYRFPVAFKFRRAYGVENQCRLNGWGRRLARRATVDPQSAELRNAWQANLRDHALEHFDAYGRHIEYVASKGLAIAPADSFTLATQLPIPILL
jgi:hypothetical protein